ncbi:octaprenyl-diphosphate synthase [Desulfocicer vacuolatum DSM 3385]|uniref:Octaprenyl-diphosphate synthase n=1 Tax=Desulfocicer vacuolatum DSM 3385 TaxID=1121400 RepID=A0A1W2DX03_9BACT|nr:polyprenyl synthetase family protein [Desulfocicer vacuolatum]SMD01969.1 octaprenyl-diphosphate synthase [Desulfocicer vacuolatum DSM 3385]
MKQELKRRLISLVEQDLIDIETALHGNLTPNLPLVKEIAGHLLFSGGKRIRPLLMILSARLCGYRGNDTIGFSTIFEYLHAATLLHDDVVDEADLRRGKPAAHTQWSRPKVVLTGDFLLARSLSLAAKTGLPDIIAVMANITEEMSQGEIEQMEQKGNARLTEAQYMTVIQRKTAVLLQGACKSGGILARAGNKKEAALDAFGYHLGVAFQMADDLLDYTAKAETLGKNPGADIREGKLTLPLIKALENAPERDRTWMLNVIADPDFDEKDFNTLQKQLHQYKGIEYTEQKAAHHIDLAKQSLGVFTPCQAMDTMMLIADYAIARNV